MRKLLICVFCAVCTNFALAQDAPVDSITKYRQMYGVEYSVGDLTPTLCGLCEVPRPDVCQGRAYEPILRLAEEKLGKKGKIEKVLVFCPDAIGAFLVPKYPEDFERLAAAADGTAEGANVMDSVTPVCFGTIFTGASPEVHGIRYYARPVLKVQTLFDVFHAAGKKVAIVAVRNCSIDLIFRERDIDYYSMNSDAESFELTKKLLAESDYDLIISYDGNYDHTMHAKGTDAPESLAAMRDSIRRYCELAELIDTCWASSHRMILFAPDHGAHNRPNGTGTHGTETEADMRVNHYYRIREGR